jgi:hypothetical protein
LDNARRIAEHNAKPNTTYKLGHNFSSDLTAEEFERLYTNPMLVSLKTKKPRPAELSNLRKDLPETVDWVAQGAVTGVKD